MNLLSYTLCYFMLAYRVKAIIIIIIKDLLNFSALNWFPYFSYLMSHWL